MKHIIILTISTDDVRLETGRGNSFLLVAGDGINSACYKCLQLKKINDYIL